jgi:hypothetical protein
MEAFGKVSLQLVVSQDSKHGYTDNSKQQQQQPSKRHFAGGLAKDVASSP